MEDSALSDDLRGFIANQIDSVVQLEMLLMLHKEPERSYAPADVAKELRIEPAWAGSQLLILAQRGLISVLDAAGSAFRYGPNTPALAKLVDDLARAYADRRVTVISLIYSKPADTLRSFADAFRLRKDPDA